MKTKTLNECKEIIAIKHEYSDFAQIEMTDDEPWEKMETKGRIMCQAAELYASQFQQKDVQPEQQSKLNDSDTWFCNNLIGLVDSQRHLVNDGKQENINRVELFEWIRCYVLPASSKTLQEALEQQFPFQKQSDRLEPEHINAINSDIKKLRQIFTQGYSAGQSSMKQVVLRDEEIERWVKEHGYYGHCTQEYHEGLEEGAKYVRDTYVIANKQEEND